MEIQSTETTKSSAVIPFTSTEKTESLDQSTAPNDTTTEFELSGEPMVQPISNNTHDNLIASENHLSIKMRHETVEGERETRSVLKEIAATGKLCKYDWERLKRMLSLQLKQVFSEYPQAKMTSDEQKVSLGETHDELLKRLDHALLSFIDGPPFTLQRLSEIILDARSLYPNLSKLAFALQKNLSVTSTLIMSTGPPSLITANGLENVTKDPNPSLSLELQSNTVMENGALPVTADQDEIMTEVEADVIDDVITMDVENVESLESRATTTDMGGRSGMSISKL